MIGQFASIYIMRLSKLSIVRFRHELSGHGLVKRILISFVENNKVNTNFTTKIYKLTDVTMNKIIITSKR